MKTLLLDKMYRPIAFLSLKKMTRLIVTGKAEVLSEWENVPLYKNMNYPAIIHLVGTDAYIRRRPVVPRFNFKGIFRRDKFFCQYTGKVLPSSQLTVDHIIPKARGGKSSWENCVTASLTVNAAKGNRTPEEAGLKLLNKPAVPTDPLALEYSIIPDPHPDWEQYFPNIRNESAFIRDELEKLSKSA